MCQAQSPQPQIRCRVRDAAQAVLYGVNGLMKKLVCKVKLNQQEDSSETDNNNNNKYIIINNNNNNKNDGC